MIALHLKKLPMTREVSLLILAYLYLPIFVLIAYSFNANRSATVWTEFSFPRYGRILANPSIQTAALNSIIVAGIATVCATAIVLLAALATYRPFYGQKMVEGGINLPLILPEIVTAVATLPAPSLNANPTATTCEVSLTDMPAQVPMAASFFTRSMTKATISSAMLACAPGITAPTATIRCSR